MKRDTVSMRKNMMSYGSGPYYDVGGHTMLLYKALKKKEKRIGLLIEGSMYNPMFF